MSYLLSFVILLSYSLAFAENPSAFIENRDFSMSFDRGISNTHNYGKYNLNFSAKEDVVTSVVKEDYRLVTSKSRGKITRITEIRRDYNSYDDSERSKLYKLSTASLDRGSLNSFTHCEAKKRGKDLSSFIANGCITVTPSLCERISGAVKDKKAFMEAMRACGNIRRVSDQITSALGFSLRDPVYVAQVSANRDYIESQAKKTLDLSSFLIFSNYDVKHNKYLDPDMAVKGSLHNSSVRRHVELCSRVREFLPSLKSSSEQRKVRKKILK